MEKNYIIESFCCTEEINTLSINSTSIKFSKKKKKQRKKEMGHCQHPLDALCPPGAPLITISQKAPRHRTPHG